MDWKGCKYASIAQLITDSEVEKMMDVMIENCDNNDKYYESFKKEELLKTYVHNSEFFTTIDDIARQEIKKETNGELDPFSFIDSEYREINILLRKEHIYNIILGQIKSIAIKKRNERFFLRLHIGEKVNFDDCANHFPFWGKVEFYKDGGWGLADEDGSVILKNHLKQRPSKIFPLVNKNAHNYLLIQDRDTELYGVLSLDTFNEVIHCQYEKIEIVEYVNRIQNFFIKVEKNYRWGCFDNNCALIIDCKYDDIYLKGDYIECIKDGKEYVYDTLTDKGYERFIDGKKDLYNLDGTLLIGGYSQLDITYGYMQFYFGTEYESYYVEESDIYNNMHELSKLRLNYDESRCLILDRNFKTIIKNKDGLFQLQRGFKLDALEDITGRIPSDILFKYRVDLNHIYDGFVYLHNINGEQFIIPHYIINGYNTPEELEDYIKIFKESLNKLGYENEISTEIVSNFTKEMYFDDSIVTIIKLNEEKGIEWIEYVNEIATSNYTTYIYRRGKKYGIYNKNGLEEVTYDAISRDTRNGKIFVALYECRQELDDSHINNPNCVDWHNKYIHYYEINNGSLKRLEDDWTVFNPTDYKWYPYDFIDINYKFELRKSLDDCDNGYEWTDEDAWDAMTDGMYGDYPGPGWDPEWFGY